MLFNLQQAALERVEAATTGFGRLPDEVWFVVAKHLDEYDRIAFGLTCKTFLETVTAASPKEKKKALTLRTNLAQKTLLKQMPRFSMGWFQWVFQSFERKKGGSIKVMKWLRSQGIPLGTWNWDYGVVAAAGAAAGGHIDVLKWLQSQDPPCPWDEKTCSAAAEGGHLDVLQWARSQDPPCDWDERTCSNAAAGGHLDVLQWA
ncbi:F-box domain-containing protein [Chloropicon primus]|nr:F-box domain-containing protein [Chloropicon primus]